MFRRRNENLPYTIGILLSLFVHIAGIVVSIVVLESRRAEASLAPQVFTVTLEGGEKLGGISQVPKSSEKQKVLPDVPNEASVPESEPEPEPEQAAEETEAPVEAKKIESPTAIEELEKKKQEEELKKKKAEEQKRKEAEAKKNKEAEAKRKKAEEKKRKAAEAKKKREQEKKRKAEEAKKKKEAEERAKRDRDRKLAEAIKRAANRYEGESANAGGQGFGAARTGGKGMGGGTLESLEFISYRNELESHIKSGWHWLPGAKRLNAVVRVNILPTGAIQNATIVKSSGRDDFDDSILRAVYKASPVPPAPSHLYKRFQDVRITFDSHQN